MLHGGMEDVQRIVQLARELVRIPSRAGIDPIEPVVKFVESWSAENGLSPVILRDGDKLCGLYIHLVSGEYGPSLCLDACLDTAPFGDEAQWRFTPTSGDVDNGRLYGRGAADSKIAAAIFLVLLATLARDNALRKGDLYLLLDADEHTGEFGGVKEFLRVAHPRPSAAWIGYPGNHTIVAGSRGFLRGRVAVFGSSAHSGSKRKKGVNAIVRAADLVARLGTIELPQESDPEFAFGPSLSITAIRGGEGFSVVPDRCELNLDARLTPNVGYARMREIIERCLQSFDREKRGPRPTTIEWEESWPAFREPDHSPSIEPLRVAAERVFRREIPTTVSGPSNIGNFLASYGIGAMSGFGVTYDNVHATDEWCEIASVAPVFEIYREAVLTFLTHS